MPYYLLTIILSIKNLKVHYATCLLACKQTKWQGTRWIEKQFDTTFRRTVNLPFAYIRAKI